MRARTALLAGLLVAVVGCCAGCGSEKVNSGSGGPSQPPVASAPATSTTVGTAPGNAPEISNTQCPSGSKDPVIEYLAGTNRSEPSGVPLPAGFEPVAAVRCETQLKTIAGDGQWDVAVAQRATSGLDALMTALRLPSSTPPIGVGVACPAVGFVTPRFALVDAQGRIVQPNLPHGVCGMPLTQAVNALNALPWKTEAEQNISQVQTQAELDTGCPGEYKDVFELSFVASPSPGAAVPDPPDLEPTAACEYTVTPDGDSIDPGVFSHGLKLDSAQQTAIGAALDGSSSPAASACSAKASKFALLVTGSGDFAVELDGCQRMLYPDYAAVQTPAALLSALQAAGVS